MHKAKSDYFSSQIAQSNCCKDLFGVCNKLRGCNSGLSLPTALPVCDLLDAFADYFIRTAKTNRDELDSEMPVPISLPTDGPYTQSSLHLFEPVSLQCVKNTILQSSQKTCSLDPLPTSLFVECLEQLLPAVTAVINQSLQTGVFPSVFKETVVKPLLKKPSLDPNSLKNYRPISNLSFLSKVTEKIVLSQLLAYLNANSLFPTSQSGYRPGHSTETALLNMFSDILHALDNGDVTVVTLLDLSAALYTIDHNVLCQRLEHLYGISCTSLNWFSSYLSNRTQTVTINNKLSQPTLLNFGVPQGSVLGPILFILYTKTLTTLIRRHSISNQSFADDIQLHDSCRPDQIDTSVQGMQDCISDVKTWMTSNKLRLNDDKTECLLIVSNRTSLPNPHPTSIHIGDTDILFSLQAKNLGVTLTNNLSMEKHVINIYRSAYTEIRRISNIRHYLTIDATKTLLCAFVLSKLDYCNSHLSGSPKHLLDKLQKVQTSAARLVFKAHKHEHIKPLLQKLHWLPVVSRILDKVATLCYNSFAESNLVYLSEHLTAYHPSRQLLSISDTRTIRIAFTKTKTFG